MIESLEARIAPAALFVNSTTATYHDVDGDLVTVHFSKPILTPGNLGSVLATTAGGILGGEQLTSITLTGAGLAASPEGTSITITAKPQIIASLPHGDGLADVGSIDARDGHGGFDLGAVSVPGDLDHLSAGDPILATPGLASLSVISLGRLGGNNLFVDVTGKSGPIAVKSDVIGVFFLADSFGTITIGGDLRADASGNGAFINSAHGIGQIKIGGNLRGGSVADSGEILTGAGGKLAGVTIGGSLLAGSADDTGRIASSGDIGLITIGGSVQESSGSASAGVISSGGKLAGVTIGGSLQRAIDGTNGITSAGDLGFLKVGGGVLNTEIKSTAGKIGNVTFGLGVTGGGVSAATGLGNVFVTGLFNSTITSGGAMGSVTLEHRMDGGAITSHANMGAVKVLGGSLSGLLQSEIGGIAGVTVWGSLDGSVTNAGRIVCATTLGPVVITGSVLGGEPADSGSVEAATAASVKIGGDMKGGMGARSGAITVTHLGVAEVGGNVVGGGVDFSGCVVATTIGAVRIGGALDGNHANTGLVQTTGDLGSVSIGTDVVGTIYVSSGVIQCGGKLGSVTIGGSLQGNGPSSGEITSTGDIGSVKIGGNLIGGNGTSSGVISAGGNLSSVIVGGSVIGGAVSSTGEILCAGMLSSATIGGDLVGTSIADPSTDVSQTGFVLVGHLGRMLIGGSIRAGVDTSGHGSLSLSGAIVSRNEIGSLTVLGSLVGNVSSTGDLTTVSIFARGRAGLSATAISDVAIASIHVAGRVEYANIIAGLAYAGVNNADAQIGSVKVDGDWIATNLIAGVNGQGDGFGNANDVKLSGKDNADSRGAVSKIAGVIIGGSALGTASLTDGMTFGIEAQQLGSLHLGGALVPFTAGPGGDLFGLARVLGTTLITQGTTHADFVAFEVP